MDNKNIQTITWSAFEYEHKPRSNDWLWGVGLLALVGAGIAIYIHSYIFGIFILISGAMLIYMKVNPPHEFKVEINNDGIKVDNEVLVFKTLKGFTVVEGNKPKLLIETSKYFMPIVAIPIPEYSANNIKATLSDVLPELELKESRSMLFADKLGF